MAAAALLCVLLATQTRPTMAQSWLESFRLATARHDSAGRNEALSALLDFDDLRVYRLFSSALFEPDTANQAKWCLIRVGRKGFPAAYELMRQYPTSCISLFRVWQLCGPGGAREIVSALKNSDIRIRREAVNYFGGGNISSEPNRKWMNLDDVRDGIRPFLSDREPATRAASVRAAFSYFAREEARTIILKGLSDPSPEVRESAARYLFYNDEEFDRVCIAASRDPAEQVRSRALGSLDRGYDGMSPDRAAARVGALIERLDDSSPEIRAGAISMLSRWHHPDGWYGYPTRRPSAEGEATIARIRKLMEDRKVSDAVWRRLAEPRAYDSALCYLAYARDARAWPLLTRDASSGDHSRVRNAVEWLGAFGDRRAIPLLQKLATDPSFREPAERSLRRLTSQDGF